MDIKQSLVTAIRNLCVNKLRFVHATLGMMIGIAGIIVVLIYGSTQMKVFDDMEDEYDPALLLMLVSTDLDLPVRITSDDMMQLAVDNPDVIKGISPWVVFDLAGGVRYGERSHDEAALYGVGPSYIDAVPLLHLQEGRFLNDMDITRERKVCVIESGIANNLLDGDALGKEIKIWGERYTVVGVLAEVPNFPGLANEVFIPYTNAKKMVGDEFDYSGDSYEDRYFVCANGTENMYETQVLVKEMIRERTGRERGQGWWLTVSALMGLFGSMSDMAWSWLVQYLLYVGIVLLIGGVGVMNVMLASVQARTKEIGIRKAFGATNRDIKRQFTLESVITGLVGSFLGVVIGFAIIFGICVYNKIPLSYLSGTGWSVLLAVVVSVGVGVVFGTYPARQAAKLEIVEALNEG